MKCSTHNSSDAVGTCSSCNRGLCTECVDRYQPPACMACAKTVNKNRKRVLLTQISSMLLLVLLIGFTLPIYLYFKTSAKSSLELLNAIFLFTGLALFPYGAKAVSRKAPIFFCNMLFAFFLFPIYFTLSFLIGYIVGPVKLVLMIRELMIINYANKIDSSYTENENCLHVRGSNADKKLVNYDVLH